MATQRSKPTHKATSPSTQALCTILDNQPKLTQAPKMDKLFFIEQPPLAKKITLLVDEINSNNTRAKTTDPEKIKFNMPWLGERYNDEMEMEKLSGNKGAKVVFPLGRYIVVSNFELETYKGFIEFFDFEVNLKREEIESSLIKQYGEKSAKIWLKAYDFLNAVYEDNEEYDIIKLVKVID